MLWIMQTKRMTEHGSLLCQVGREDFVICIFEAHQQETSHALELVQVACLIH